MGMWTLLLLFAFGIMLFQQGFGNLTQIEHDYEAVTGVYVSSQGLPLSYYIMLMIGCSGGGLAIGSMLEIHRRIEQAQKCEDDLIKRHKASMNCKRSQGGEN